MRLEPILTEVEASIESQLRMAERSVAEAAVGFLEAFRPAVRTALLQVAEQAAAEVGAQLADRRVDVRLSGGDPELIVTPTHRQDLPDQDDGVEARITLRLPASLKGLIEDAASSSGDSINGWVVDALRSNARRRSPGTTIDETFQL